MHSLLAAPEPMNMQNPNFNFKTPHSTQPSVSLSASQPHAPVPGPSSSAPGTSTPAQLSSSGPSGHCVQQHLMHKNRLQEYAQRSNMPLPVYHTVNEGLAHAPKFRATVCVDGRCYTSQNVFSVRKAAEQDVAKLAYEHIVTSIKHEGLPDVFEKTMFFKSILNEFAAKMNLDKVTYRTFQLEGNFFVSSLVFNGESYVGHPARSKKEAEQSAARTAILSNLSDSRLGTRLSEVIKSKFRFCAAISNGMDSQHTSNVSHMASSGYVPVNSAPMTANINESKKFEVALPRGLQQQFQMSNQEKSGLQQLFQMSNQEKYPEDSKLSNLSQQAGEPQHVDDISSLKPSSLSQQAVEPQHIDDSSSSKPSNLSQQAVEPQHIDDSSSSKPSNLSQQAGEPQHIDDSSSSKPSNLSQQAVEPQHIDDSSSSKPSNLSQQAGEPQHIDDSSISKPSNLSQQAGEPQHIDDSSSSKPSNLSQQAVEPRHIDDSSSSKPSNLSQQAVEPQHIDDGSSSKPSNLSQQAVEPQHIDDGTSSKPSNLSQQAGEPQHIDDSSSSKPSNLSQQAVEPQHIDDSLSSKLSNLSQQAGGPQHIDDSSSSKKRKKNKKKANKKSRMDSLMPVAAFPVNQAPPPCVAVPFHFGQPSCSVLQ